MPEGSDAAEVEAVLCQIYAGLAHICPDRVRPPAQAMSAFISDRCYTYCVETIYKVLPIAR